MGTQMSSRTRYIRMYKCMCRKREICRRERDGEREKEVEGDGYGERESWRDVR